MDWEYDPEHGGLLYIRLAEGQVDGTIRLDDDTLVDVAADGRVLGVEVLNGAERLPGLEHYPRGALQTYTSAESMNPPFSYCVARNGPEERQRLAALVERLLTILWALAAPAR